MPYPIWLDSAQSPQGEWDILSAAPAQWIESRANATHMWGQDSSVSAQIDPQKNPFELIKALVFKSPLAVSNELQFFPFKGGALGYFSYDLVTQTEPRIKKAYTHFNQTENNLDTQTMPLMAIGIYPWAILQNHKTQQAWLLLNDSIDPTYDFSNIVSLCKNNNFENCDARSDQHHKKSKAHFSIETFKATTSFVEYEKKFNRIKAYINAGDVYQVNFAQVFKATCVGDSFLAYLSLRSRLKSPFSAYMQFNNTSILSFSPERFIKLQKNIAETQPIKGTIARSTDAQEDLANAQKLQSSLKDKAENLMIVDLLRNDFSKTCDQVETKKLFELQSFANVHHLVSTVTGKLRSNFSAVDLLAQAFPGGSITGAPKIRAMEIIAELESEPRGVYCGSIGYISCCGNMDTSIAIRTLQCNNNEMICWGGGGIVADSICDNEYQESITKIKLLMSSLEEAFNQRVDLED